MKSVLLALLGLLGLALPLTAQTSLPRGDVQTITREELEETGEVETGAALTLHRGDIFRGVDSAALIHGLPVLTLLDGRRFPLSTQLGRTSASPVNDLPVAFLRSVEVQPNGGAARYGSDGPGGTVNLRLNRLQTGGEVGVFYGRSSGKYGREDYSAYIMGGIGNDKFNLTVGAAYHESHGKIPRDRR